MQDFVLVEKSLEGSSEFYTVVRVQPTWRMFAFQDLLKGIRHCIAAVGSQGLCVDLFAKDIQHNQNILERLLFFGLLGQARLGRQIRDVRHPPIVDTQCCEFAFA